MGEENGKRGGVGRAYTISIRVQMVKMTLWLYNDERIVECREVPSTKSSSCRLERASGQNSRLANRQMLVLVLAIGMTRYLSDVKYAS